MHHHSYGPEFHIASSEGFLAYWTFHCTGHQYHIIELFYPKFLLQFGILTASSHSPTGHCSLVFSLRFSCSFRLVSQKKSGEKGKGRESDDQQMPLCVREATNQCSWSWADAKLGVESLRSKKKKWSNASPMISAGCWLRTRLKLVSCDCRIKHSKSLVLKNQQSTLQIHMYLNPSVITFLHLPALASSATSPVHSQTQNLD